MTGSSSSAIDAVVVQWNMGGRHKLAAISYLGRTPQLVEAIRAEIARLEAPAARRYLLHPDRGDAVSKKLHVTLCEMLQALT